MTFVGSVSSTKRVSPTCSALIVADSPACAEERIVGPVYPTTSCVSMIGITIITFHFPSVFASAPDRSLRAPLIGHCERPSSVIANAPDLSLRAKRGNLVDRNPPPFASRPSGRPPRHRDCRVAIAPRNDSCCHCGPFLFCHCERSAAIWLTATHGRSPPSPAPAAVRPHIGIAASRSLLAMTVAVIAGPSFSVIASPFFSVIASEARQSR